MGKSFAVGEPFLRGGKVRPVCGAYLPAHFSGKLVAVQSGLLTDHLLKLGKALFVMHKELIYALVRSDPAAVAVPRKRCCHIQTAYLIKANDIIRERILYGRPESDIGRDVKKYMVTREHQGFLPVKETHVAGSVAGSLYTFKAEFAVGQHVAVIDQPGVKGLRQILHGGIMQKDVLKILIGHTVLKRAHTAILPAVAAAGAFIGPKALQVAATVKMIQNVLIGVTAFCVAMYWCAKVDVQEGQKVSAMEIWHRFPKFVLGFLTASIVMSVVSSSLGADVGKMLVDNGINKISVPLRGWFFALAFVSIGLTTNFRELGKYFKGGKPILLYVCGQSLNLALTLLMAWIMFYKVFPEITAKI